MPVNKGLFGSLGSKPSYWSSPDSGQLRSKQHQREIWFPSSVSLGHSASLHLSFPPLSSSTTTAQPRSPAVPVPASRPRTQGTEKPERLFPEPEAKSDAEVTQEHRPLRWSPGFPAHPQQRFAVTGPPQNAPRHRGGLGRWGGMESPERPKDTPLHSRGCVPEGTCRRSGSF